MMNYEEFKQEVADNIKEYLNESFENASVDIKQIVKNNGMELDGLIIRKEDENITPNIYLNSLFDEYTNGKGMEEIMQNIADIREHAGMESLPFSIEDIRNIDKVKEKIECRLVNCENNAEFLEGKPFTQVEDLAVIYTVNLGRQGQDGLMSTTVNDMLLADWGISTEELHSIAIENLENSGIQLKSMRDQLMELMFPDGAPDDQSMDFMLPPDDAQHQMYVLTNREKNYGAKAVLDTQKMDEIAEKLGGDFVIIPSSVHEVLILPNAAEMDRSALEQMVNTVNATEVSPNDVLSNNIYCYDAQNHELMRGDHYQERLQEKSLMAAVGEIEAAYGTKAAQEQKATKTENHHERKSVKAQIAEKKDIIAKTAAEKANPVKNHNKEI